MGDSLFFYPQRPKSGDYSNPYSQNYKDCLDKYFVVIDKNVRQKGMQAFGLLKYSIKADVYILNWIESIPFLRLGFIQFIIVFFSFVIMKLRNACIIWMFHNIRPHQGNNWMSRYISNWLFANSTFIVSHSQEAADYAKGRAKCKVEYRCHPIETIDVDIWPKHIDSFDVFIWGSILPYKGIAEFVSLPNIQDSNLTIKIIGFCKDKALDQQIRSYTNKHIIYENRRADFAEIAANCKASKYVLFPYIGECVSSSGALMDTIILGGTPIGPNVGAFKDLSKEGVCLTYSDYDSLLRLLMAPKNMCSNHLDSFIENNTWNKMAKFISDRVSLYHSSN